MPAVNLYKEEIKMKILQAYAIINEASNTNALKGIASKFENLDIHYVTDIENIVAGMGIQNFQLLILDEGLPDEDIKKLHRIVELLHPDAVVSEFNLANEDYILYKLSGLMLRWEEAHSDGKINFIDNPL